MRISKRGVAAAVVAATTMAGLPAAMADISNSANLGKVDYATMSGRMNLARTHGWTTFCTSVASAGGGSQCSADWTLDQRVGDICNVQPGQLAGVGNFYDPNDGLNLVQVRLFGAVGSGTGVLVGYGFVSGTNPFKYEVNAHNACVAQPALESLADTASNLGVNTRPVGDSWKGDVSLVG